MFRRSLLLFAMVPLSGACKTEMEYMKESRQPAALQTKTDGTQEQASVPEDAPANKRIGDESFSVSSNGTNADVITADQTLVVDWGDALDFVWSVEQATSAALELKATRADFAKRYTIEAKDLPAGRLRVDSSEVPAGPYQVTLTVETGKGSRSYELAVHVRPVVQLNAGETLLQPRVGEAVPIEVEVKAGADLVRLYLNGSSSPATMLEKLGAGKHQAMITLTQLGSNSIKATVRKNGLAGLPAFLSMTTREGCSPGKGDDGKGTKGLSLGKGTDDCETPGQNPPEEPQAPQIGIKAHLVNWFPGTCRRLEVRGDASSTETVGGPNCKGPQNLNVLQDWYSAKDFGLPQATVKGSIFKQHKGEPLPTEFPVLDFEALKTKVAGTLRSSAVPVSSWYQMENAPSENIVGKVQRNLVLVGTTTQPIYVNGDVLVVGDLIIKGYYQGTGTIYVTGNVFMPHDVKAVSSAFPFAIDPALAKQQGKDRIGGKRPTDSLSIVAGNYVFAGDNYPLYQDPTLNPHVQAMYAWYVGNKKGYKKLHEPVWNCQTNTFPGYNKAAYDQCDCHVQGGFNLIEANLYARYGIHGSSGSWPNPQTYVPNSFAINGTVITNKFDVVTTPDLCITPQDAHPVHKLPQGSSYVNYDWRFYYNANGMTHLKPFYKH